MYIFSQQLGRHDRAVASVKVSSNQRFLASASADKTVNIYDLETKERKNILNNAHTAGLNDVVWMTGDTHVFTASDDKTVKLWDVETGTAVSDFHGHKGFVFCLSCHPNSNIVVSGSYDETIRMWDIRAKECVGEVEAHADPVTAVNFNSSGDRFLTSSYDGLIRVWDTKNLSLEKSMHATNSPPV